MRSYARENQDLFIAAIFNKKLNGTYLEVGGFQPINWNNTYLLEKDLQWTGVSIELKEEWAAQWPGVRNNPCIVADATAIDYNSFLEEHGMYNYIDYLSLDIDPAEATYDVLNKLDFNTYTFGAITYEHDAYFAGNGMRDASRELLDSYGYKRVLSDVQHKDLKFEDWYIMESLMTNDNWKLFEGEGVAMDTPNMAQKIKNIFEELLK